MTRLDIVLPKTFNGAEQMRNSDMSEAKKSPDDTPRGGGSDMSKGFLPGDPPDSKSPPETPYDEAEDDSTIPIDPPDNLGARW